MTMNAEIAVPSRSNNRPPAAVSLFSPWTPPVLAWAITLLLDIPVSAGQVRAKAIGLGLLRQPKGDGPSELTQRAAARLLLAYRLPATVENGTLAAVHEHCRAGRWTFVVLASTEPVLYQVLDVEVASFSDALILTERGGSEVQSWPLESFAEAWAATGNGLLVAARSWSELPTQGALFFGGQRDTDGAYHWNTAECDSDGEGRILRF
jgi:hypothetical protein